MTGTRNGGAMRAERDVEANGPEAVEVTFRGRGLGVVQGSRLLLKICPLCSQRNAVRTAQKGIYHWCAYEPSRADVEPVPGA